MTTIKKLCDQELVETLTKWDEIGIGSSVATMNKFEVRINSDTKFDETFRSTRKHRDIRVADLKIELQVFRSFVYSLVECFHFNFGHINVIDGNDVSRTLFFLLMLEKLQVSYCQIIAGWARPRRVKLLKLKILSV